MKKHLVFVLVLAVLSIIACPVLMKPVYAQQTSMAKYGSLPMDSYTLSYWNEARDYRSQNRLELSRQSFLMALATCKDTLAMYQIKRELQSINLQIKSLR